MQIEQYRFGFLGFGHMAQIILRRVLGTQLISSSQILFHQRDPAKAIENEKKFGIASATMEQIVSQSDILLLCVRPQQAGAVLAELSKLNLTSKMLLSIMAGISISLLQSTHQGLPIARIMPNVASEVGEGLSLVTFGAHCNEENKSSIRLLCSALGKFVEISEQFMDIGTGMAGSGIAFVLYLIEAMAQLGVKEGMSHSQALTIAAQTFSGAASMIFKKESVQDLLTQIATPGGVTIEGLDVLRSGEVKQRFQAAILAASEKAKKISLEI